MNVDMVMQELQALGKERMKKLYIANGAREELFGVATGEMKPLAKKIKKNQVLAEQLYRTGNYDAMYFAGIIAEPEAMTEADFERWIDGAYFYMVSDYVVAVTLAEAHIAQQVADKWIASGEELKMSAGWSCYCWIIGSRPDHVCSESKIASMLDLAEHTIHNSPERTKYAMNQFVYTVGISYVPLHDLAVKTAHSVGPVEYKRENKEATILLASGMIQQAIDKGRIGFKRKHVRC
jgi:3-methyladenine DNA glycosylase AlkD